MVTHILEHNGGHKGDAQFKGFLAVGRQYFCRGSGCLTLPGLADVHTHAPRARAQLIRIGAQHAVDQIEGLPNVQGLNNAGMECIQFALIHAMLTKYLALASGCVVVELHVTNSSLKPQKT